MSDNNNSVKRAEQRVREMNTVTRRYAEQGNRYIQNMANSRQTRFETVDVRPEELSKPQKPPVCPPKGTPNTPRRNVPQGVKNAEKDAENVHKSVPPKMQGSDGLDGERLLLLAVIYLLMRENADIKLILALCYLIL